MSRRISIVLILFCLFTLTSVSAKDIFTLVIDAGHGGKDAGALGAFSKEKDINLNVALAFGKYVEQNLSDVKVVYTRTTDIFIPLNRRAQIANKAKANLFISIHTNSVPPTKTPPQGFQVYTLGMHRAKDNLDVAMRENSVISLEKGYERTYEGFDPKSSESYIMFEIMQSANMEKSVELARLIQSYVCKKANRSDKGVHQAGFLVLRETSMPSCLIELGFITHQEEERFLNSAEGIDLMARGIYEAFVEYKNRYHGQIQIPYRPQNDNKLSVVNVLPNIVGVKNKVVEKPVKAKDIKVKPQTQVQSPKKQPTKTVTKKPVVVEKEIVKKKIVDSKKESLIFKVQVFAINHQLTSGSSQFKGHTDITYFVEGRWYKYTIGNSTDYNEINRLLKKVKADFPEAFIVAFKNGKRIDTSEAIKEFLQNKKKK